MSSWKKAAKMHQKTHRERHQPESRKHLGLLEKKQDYVVRARKQAQNKAALSLLQKRALNKNPDEFYFHMINSKLEDGVHHEKPKDKSFTQDQIKLMEGQDLRYLTYKRNIEAKKIEKLQTQHHMLNATDEMLGKHTFFVDDNDDVKEFSLAKRLNTHSAFLKRRANRPRLDDLKKMNLRDVDPRLVAKIEQRKHMAYSELNKRIDREQQLAIVQQELEIKRALKDKKAAKKLRTQGKNQPMFERKR